MTLNYVKHDEEFHCTIKLVNGEELIGKVIVSRDKTTFPATDLLYVQDPLVVQSFTKEMDETKAVKGIGFTQWQNFSDEDFYIVNEKDVISVASLSREMIFVYESFLHSQRGQGEKDKLKKEHRVDVTEKEGMVGKISEARKKFEDLFKNS
tara:strand:- start:261 stop:713 length:453 start_codon:yes stop_codon:yes gene_type:complete